MMGPPHDSETAISPRVQLGGRRRGGCLASRYSIGIVVSGNGVMRCWTAPTRGSRARACCRTWKVASVSRRLGRSGAVALVQPFRARPRSAPSSVRSRDRGLTAWHIKNQKMAPCVGAISESRERLSRSDFCLNCLSRRRAFSDDLLVLGAIMLM